MNKLLLAALFAATTAAPRIGTLVDKVLKMPEVPSIGMVVVRDGATVYAHNANTGYYIGSTTKAYTGLACAILATRGQLDLDAPISKYLPEVKLTTTLRQFLTHTQGIDADAVTIRTAYSGEHTPQQLATLLNAAQPRQPGFHYDNLGYVVASLVIERITGKPWQKALDELVFTPLKMDHTTAYMSEAEKWPLATPYSWRDGRLAAVSYRKTDATMHAAGGIVTTPADLVRWLKANISRGRVGTRQVIPAKAFEEAQRLQVPVADRQAAFPVRGYGFGWYQGDYAGNAVLVHGGGYEGWQSVFTFMPEQKIGVGIMVNAGGPSRMAIEELARYAYDELLGNDYDPAQRSTDLRAKLDKIDAAIAADAAKRAERQWTLLHPNPTYVGRYANDAYGTIEIDERNGHLLARMGIVKAPLEAYMKPETARVELTGGGTVIEFAFDGDRVTSLRWNGETFTRTE